MLLAVEYSGIRIAFKKSDIFHHDSERAVFAARVASKESIVEFHYSSLVYKNLISYGFCLKIYIKSKVNLMREMLLKLASHLP